jgi:hypothetical protein
VNPTSARLAKFFRALADACEKLTEDELDFAISEFQSFTKALKSGEPHRIFGGPTHRRGTLDYLPGSQAPRKSVRGRSTKIGKSPISPATVLDQLNRANSRKEGEKILQNLKLSRNELLAVANARSVYVSKDDNVRRIHEKLVESIIGTKLDSGAIRGGEPSKAVQ